MRKVGFCFIQWIDGWNDRSDVGLCRLSLGISIRLDFAYSRFEFM